MSIIFDKYFVQHYIIGMKETLKILREQNGYSQTYLASYLKASRQMYIKYETGEVEPPVRVVRELCKLYSVPYETLIDNKLSANGICLYPSESETELQVASASPSYSVSDTDNLQIANLLTQIRKLPQKCIPSVSAFILLLQQEEKKAKTKAAGKSKKAFFELAGTINLDTDEITAFREGSMI